MLNQSVPSAARAVVAIYAVAHIPFGGLKGSAGR
jgi:hypothetical protein